MIWHAFLFVLVPARFALAASPGFVEGHLNIVSLKEVEFARNDASPVTPKAHPHNYGEYPLIILSKEGQREVSRVTADDRGNFRVSLPPGNYILDIPRRGLVRAKPQPFTVASGQTVHVDMNLDTGIR